MHRVSEIVVALMGLMFLSPLLAVIAFSIWLHDGGPVLFRAKRVGKDGKHFDLFKFRTMVVDAHTQGHGITQSNDARITSVGRFLRDYKLDELPQLINVVRGEMSLVGPRPEDPRFVDRYGEEHKPVLSFRPGITSPASLHFRDEEQMLTGSEWLRHYTDTILPKKLSMDLRYCTERNAWDDVKIIMRTIGGMFGEKTPS